MDAVKVLPFALVFLILVQDALRRLTACNFRNFIKMLVGERAARRSRFRNSHLQRALKETSNWGRGWPA